MDCSDWPWWLMFIAAMVSSYFQETRLRRERNDPRCTLFYTYYHGAAAQKLGLFLYPAGLVGLQATCLGLSKWRLPPRP